MELHVLHGSSVGGLYCMRGLYLIYSNIHMVVAQSGLIMKSTCVCVMSIVLELHTDELYAHDIPVLSIISMRP